MNTKGTEKIPFSALPLDPKGPRGNAWGRFGPNDQLGMLNLLTPDVVAAAGREIQSGVRISLDWSMDKPTYNSFERDPFHQHINNRRENSINDDILTFNSQCSSQWDGFRHYVVAENGGIVGRGVLIDYAEWAERNSITVQPLESTAITLRDLKKVVQDMSLEIRQGDIILLRVGFTRAYDRLNDGERKALAQRPSPGFIGVEATIGMLEWIWDLSPAAVGGDAAGFERCPIRGSHANPMTSLHEWFLAGWGLPIGEMFDLEPLSAQCKSTGRYSFFFSSVPIKVPGGVASPPCAVAVF